MREVKGDKDECIKDYGRCNDPSRRHIGIVYFIHHALTIISGSFFLQMLLSFCISGQIQSFSP